MKKIILSFICVIYFSNQSFAQIVMADTVVLDPLPKDGLTHMLHDTIINNTANAITVNWTKSAEFFVAGVQCIVICDPTVCYPCGAPLTPSFTIPAWGGAAIYVEAKALPSAADGSSYVTISTNYGDMVYKYNTVPGPAATCNADFFMYEDSTAAPHTYIGINTCMGNGLSYDWSWGDGTPNSSGPFPTHTYAAAGIYNICVAISDPLNCTDTFCSSEIINKTLSSWYTITFAAPTAVNDQQIKNVIVYPNPVKDVLHINGESNMKYKMDIYSIIGAKVQTAEVRSNDAIDIAALPAGMYLLKISDANNGYHYHKLQKE